MAAVVGRAAGADYGGSRRRAADWGGAGDVLPLAWALGEMKEKHSWAKIVLGCRVRSSKNILGQIAGSAGMSWTTSVPRLVFFFFF